MPENQTPPAKKKSVSSKQSPQVVLPFDDLKKLLSDLIDERIAMFFTEADKAQPSGDILERGEFGSVKLVEVEEYRNRMLADHPNNPLIQSFLRNDGELVEFGVPHWFLWWDLEGLDESVKYMIGQNNREREAFISRLAGADRFLTIFDEFKKVNEFRSKKLGRFPDIAVAFQTPTSAGWTASQVTQSVIDRANDQISAWLNRIPGAQSF